MIWLNLQKNKIDISIYLFFLVVNLFETNFCLNSIINNCSGAEIQ